MNRVFHILNGDQLRELFPSDISGDIYVLRECFIDGPLTSKSNKSLYDMRATFISDRYEVATIEQYYILTVYEFDKIQKIPNGSEINLWFDTDLFCQINLWFLCNLLTSTGNQFEIHIVLPNETNPFHFRKEDLHNCFEKRKAVSPKQVHLFSERWHHFVERDLSQLSSTLQECDSSLPFIKSTIDMIEELFSGIIKARVEEIIAEVGDDFSKLFPLFVQKYPQYGFGDLQVKRIMNDLLSK